LEAVSTSAAHSGTLENGHMFEFFVQKGDTELAQVSKKWAGMGKEFYFC
jgi:hypothetical protein